MAASDYTIDVVKFIRQKTISNFESPVYFGTEQRFVGALPNSNNNNLEEQFLLGTDTYTEVYSDTDGNQIIEKSFKKDGEDTNYYKLVSIIYASGQQHNEDFYFDNDAVHILDKDDIIVYTDPELDFEDDSFIAFNIQEGQTSLSILPNTLSTTRMDTLYYIDGSGNSILVATKTTEKRLSKGREIVRELVEDKLGLD